MHKMRKKCAQNAQECDNTVHGESLESPGADALATLEVLGLGRHAHSVNVVVAAVRRRPEAVVAVPGAGLALCKRRPTTWLLEARLGWLGRPRAPPLLPGFKLSLIHI